MTLYALDDVQRFHIQKVNDLKAQTGKATELADAEKVLEEAKKAMTYFRGELAKHVECELRDCEHQADHTNPFLQKKCVVFCVNIISLIDAIWQHTFQLSIWWGNVIQFFKKNCRSELNH